MKPSSINDVVKLPSELERQQIFYWLKKLSSLTAWRRIFEYYQAWAEVTEKSVRQADNNGIGDDTEVYCQ
jgi:hypothetical protein